VAAFGTGSKLWRVEVVLRRGTALPSTQEQVLDLLASWQRDQPSSTDERVHPSLRATSSYDLAAPDGEVGVACWVRADSLGKAAQIGYDVVARAFAEVTGQPADLWDLRLLPRTAITDARNS
jgi:hypothetical protein